MKSFNLRETIIVIGNITSGTMNVNTPDQPTRRQIMIVPPINPKGSMKPAITKVSFCSIELKSLESKLIIFPTCSDLIIKDVIFDTLLYISRISADLILQLMIGTE